MEKTEAGTTSAVLNRPMFLWSLPFAFLYFAMPVVSKEMGASAVEIGGLFSVFTGTTLLLRPVVGWLLDRWSPKVFLVTALFIYGAAMVAYAFADSLGWLYAARIIQAIGSSCLWTSTYTFIANVTELAGRGKALGRLNEITGRGQLVGIFAAFMVMGVLPEDMAWRVVFLAFAVTSAVGASMAWRQVPAHTPRKPVGGTPGISPRLIRLLVIVLLMGIPEAMLAPVYLIYLQDKFQASMQMLAWAFFPAALAAALLSSRLGELSDRYGRVPMMALGLVGAGVVALVMPSLPSLIWLAVLYLATTIMWSISEPAETALVADLTGQERRGLAYGLYDFFENVGFVIGPLLGGLAYDLLGNASPFYLYGIMSVVGAALVWILLRQRSETATITA